MFCDMIHEFSFNIHCFVSQRAHYLFIYNDISPVQQHSSAAVLGRVEVDVLSASHKWYILVLQKVASEGS